MPDPVEQEPENKQENKQEKNTEQTLAELNKLLFVMTGEHKNQPSYLPHAKFSESKIATNIKSYQATIKELETKLAAAELEGDTANNIKAQLQDISSKLKALNTNLNKKFDDWIGCKRAMDKKTVWDPAFKGLNESLAKLHKQIDTVAKANPANETIKEFQSASKALNADSLQNKTFNEDVRQLKDRISSQDRTQFSFVKGYELGYVKHGEEFTTKIWKKVDPDDEKKIEAEAKKVMQGNSAGGEVSNHPDDKKWIDQVTDKGGPGLYKREGSPIYINVSDTGMLTAIEKPDEDSFISKIAQAVLVTALLPLAAAYSGARYAMSNDKEKDEMKERFLNFWRTDASKFEKSYSEILDFATLDPSGLSKSKSIRMTYSNYENISEREGKEILIANRLAEERGIGFSLHPSLAKAVAKLPNAEEIFKAVHDSKVRYEAKQQAMEAEGKKMQVSTPPLKPALEGVDVKAGVSRLKEIKSELEEKGVTSLTVETKLEEIKLIKDRMVANLPAMARANESEIKLFRDGLSEMNTAIASVQAHEKATDAVKKEAAEIHAWSSDPDNDVREVLNNRGVELEDQRELEGHLVALGLRDEDPEHESKPTQDFRSAVSEAVDEFDKFTKSDDQSKVQDHRDKLEGLQDKINTSINKLPVRAKEEEKKADKEMKEKFEKGTEQLESAKHAHKPGGPK